MEFGQSSSLFRWWLHFPDAHLHATDLHATLRLATVKPGGNSHPISPDSTCRDETEFSQQSSFFRMGHYQLICIPRGSGASDGAPSYHCRIRFELASDGIPSGTNQQSGISSTKFIFPNFHFFDAFPRWAASTALIGLIGDGSFACGQSHQIQNCRHPSQFSSDLFQSHTNR